VLTGFVVVVVVVTIVGFEYIFPLRVIMFKGSLFLTSDLTIGELAGGFLLKVRGGLLNLLLVCGVVR
jgi:hypothetical protein